MAEELIITISGMRGIVGENLDAQTGELYGCAFGTYLQSEGVKNEQGGKVSVCIGRDSRPSGRMLLSSVAEGLCSMGVDVIGLGIVPTPSVGVMVRHLGCAGGVVITASHNPIEYNGIKLLLGDGIAPPADTAEQIRKIYFNKKFGLSGSFGRGSVSSNEQTEEVHIKKVLSIVDKDTIAAKGFKVVLDSVNGAGGRIGRKLLEEFGCEVAAINDEPTGLFAHTPEPTRENLVGLCEEVTRHNADIGFAQDPDADRLAIVDENGRYIGEEYTLALAGRYVFGRDSGTAAANLSTSRMIDDVARSAGGRVIRTAVGEAHVANAMVEHGCIIGGEGNGGVIDLRVGPVRDSLVGMALVLGLMSDTGKKVGELADEISGYSMKKVKFNANKSEAARIIAQAIKLFPDTKIDRTDGVRFDFADGWVHLRSSNTEPVMRVIAEAESEDSAQNYIDKIMNIRKENLD
jgi:phosphomannomutase